MTMKLYNRLTLLLTNDNEVQQGRYSHKALILINGMQSHDTNINNDNELYNRLTLLLTNDNEVQSQGAHNN